MEAASERAQDLFSERMTDLERVTYRFFIIKKEVHILVYSLRINGMLILPMIFFFFAYDCNHYFNICFRVYKSISFLSSNLLMTIIFFM
jgi:hypothetical protein